MHLPLRQTDKADELQSAHFWTELDSYCRQRLAYVGNGTVELAPLEYAKTRRHAPIEQSFNL